jgi:hypothetical protein
LESETNVRAPRFLRHLYVPSRYDLVRWMRNGLRTGKRTWCRRHHTHPSRRDVLREVENGWNCDVCGVHFYDLVDAGVLNWHVPTTYEARVALRRRLSAEAARENAPVERGCVRCGKRPDPRSGMMLCTKHYHRNRYRLRRVSDARRSG